MTWRLVEDPGPGEWLLRCDRVDFPPGGVAHLHVHPGPGIRRLLHGELTIARHTGSAAPTAPGSRGSRTPTILSCATASATEETAFVRVLLLPRDWAGKRTIRYLDPADEEKPKLQRATVLLEEPVARVRSGGRILVDQLEQNGADLAFCLPGESFLPVLDALYDSPIRLVSCRHESGAANAAEAYGKLTGRPGICIVTRGPGATQAAVGRPHRETGLDPDAAPRRPGAAGVSRARRVAGDRLREHLRRDRQGRVGGRER